MKITTWNVNGLRAMLKKGYLQSLLALNPDILMFQEVKARAEQVAPETLQVLSAYNAYWHPAERPGYSGVANFFRDAPLKITSGIDVARFDSEGRVIWMQTNGFHLFNIYFPSGQHGWGRVNYKLEFYAALLELVDQLHSAGEAIIVGGDFNTAHREIDLRNPKQNRKTSGFLPEERAWVDRYLEHGFVDVFRELYPERAAYTWWTYRSDARNRNIGWRLDYFLVSAALRPRVKDVLINSDILGSDHCPVTLVID